MKQVQQLGQCLHQPSPGHLHPVTGNGNGVDTAPRVGVVRLVGGAVLAPLRRQSGGRGGGGGRRLMWTKWPGLAVLQQLANQAGQVPDLLPEACQCLVYFLVVRVERLYK